MAAIKKINVPGRLWRTNSVVARDIYLAVAISVLGIAICWLSSRSKSNVITEGMEWAAAQQVLAGTWVQMVMTGPLQIMPRSESEERRQLIPKTFMAPDLSVIRVVLSGESSTHEDTMAIRNLYKWPPGAALFEMTSGQEVNGIDMSLFRRPWFALAAALWSIGGLLTIPWLLTMRANRRRLQSVWLLRVVGIVFGLANIAPYYFGTSRSIGIPWPIWIEGRPNGMFVMAVVYDFLFAITVIFAAAALVRGWASWNRQRVEGGGTQH